MSLKGGVALLEVNKTTEAVIGAAIEVHRHLGPGLLESAYEECLCHELKLRNIPFKRQVPLPVNYKGVQLDCSYRLDLLVNDELVVELNFSLPTLKQGIKRLVLGLKE